MQSEKSISFTIIYFQIILDSVSSQPLNFLKEMSATVILTELCSGSFFKSDD